MQETGQITWDVVQVESSELARGCEEGAFVSLDWSKVASKSAFLSDAISECGVGMSVWSVVVAYNADKVKKTPTKLADFWDTKTVSVRSGRGMGGSTRIFDVEVMPHTGLFFCW